MNDGAYYYPSGSKWTLVGVKCKPVGCPHYRQAVWLPNGAIACLTRKSRSLSRVASVLRLCIFEINDSHTARFPSVVPMLNLASNSRLAFALLFVLPAFALSQITNPAPYCAATYSSGSCSFGDQIDQVTFNTLVNNTGCAPTDYTYFNTGPTTTVTPGMTYNVGAVMGNGVFDEFLGVYIDYNQDGDFNDTGEYVAGNGINSSLTYNGTVTIPLTALPGVTRLRFVIDFTNDYGPGDACNGTTWGETEDYNITIQPLSPDDLGIASIDTPVTQCGLGLETVRVTLANFGTNPRNLAGVSVGYQINGVTAATEILTGGTLATLADTVYEFAAQANLAAPGNYDICAFVIDPPGFGGNDTLCKSVTNIPLVNSFPYNQNFESGAGGWTVQGSNPSWVLGTPNKVLIQGANSGANAWVTGGLGATPYNSNEQSWVEGPCFDFTTIPNPVIEMAIWWDYESGDGSVLQSSIDGGASWQNVGVINDPVNWYNSTSPVTTPLMPTGNGWAGGGTGNIAPGAAPGWVNAKHDLTGLGGQPAVLLRVTLSTDNSSFSDRDGFAFDDVRIYEKQAVDLAALEVVDPQPNCGLSANEPVTIRITNDGTTARSNFPVGFQVDGGPVQTETFAGTLNPGDTVLYTFTTQFANLSTAATYNIIGFTADAGDLVNTFNDTSGVFVTENLPLINTYPYLQDFEAGNGSWYPSGTNSSWKWGAPNGTNIASASSGVNAYSTTPIHNDNEESFVISPCFDLSTISSPVLAANINWFAVTNQNGAALQYTTNGGATWQTLNAFDQGGYTSTNITSTPGGQSNGWSGSFGSSSGGYVFSVHPIQGLSGQTNVRFRYAFSSTTTTNYDGFAFDDFTIRELPNVALGPDTSLCNGDTLLLCPAPNPDCAYLWSTGDTTECISVVFPSTYIVRCTDVVGFTAEDTINVEFTLPAVNLGQDVEGCEGNAVTLDATGPPSYTYQWTGPGGFTSTAPSITVSTGSGVLPYKVVVTETANSLFCQDSDVVNITFNPVPQPVLPDAAEVCLGETVRLGAADSVDVQNVTYNWNVGVSSPALFVSAPGTYIVDAVSIFGCTGSDTTTVNVLPSPSVFLGPDIFQCDNLNVTLNAQNPGAIYNWSTGATSQTINVTQTGVYSVEVTNNLGCGAADTIVVGASSSPSINLPASSEGCGSVVLDIGPGLSNIVWSNGESTPAITVTQSGLYSVIAEDLAGCISTDQTTVTILPAPEVSFWAPETLFVGEPAQFVDGTLPIPTGWSWDFGDGTTSSQQNPTKSFSAPGDYTVRLAITAGNCAGQTAQVLRVVQTTALEDAFEQLASAVVYPNPSTGRFTLQASFVEALDGQIKVYDLAGKQLLNEDFAPTLDLTAGFDLSAQPAGLYLLEVATPAGTFRTKLMKQ